MSFPEGLQAVQTIATVFVVLMGFWLRAEFFKFKDKTIQPIVDEFREQFKDHDMALLEVRQVAHGLSSSLIDMKGISAQMAETIAEMGRGINDRTLELGRHDERIKGLTERLARLEEYSRHRRAGEFRETPR